jgi:HD superfamily phosphodiesterase
MSSSELDRVADFVKGYLYETADSSDQEWVKSFPRAAEHRWQHTLNVCANAEQILEGESPNDYAAKIVRFACLLHDVSMFTCDHAIHGQVSADIASEYLQREGYDPAFTQAVCRAVAEHGTDLGDLPPEDQGELFSWEGKVVLEADILDKLGASAIASALLYLGEQGRLNFEVRKAMVEGLAYERAEFFKDYFWTETGKRLAHHRFTFFLEFLERLEEEVVESDTPIRAED